VNELTKQDLDDIVVAEWSEILDVDGPSTDDDFFEVGGNSLLAVSLFERLEARLSVELPIDEFFADGTLGGLVAAVHAARPV
jgi:acyl carrier protein